jgi:hypothetical protein
VGINTTKVQHIQWILFECESTKRIKHHGGGRTTKGPSVVQRSAKAIFDKAGNPKDNQPFRFMHCWLYLNDYAQWFYRDPARGVQNTHNKRRAVDIDLIVGEGQPGQGSGGSPTGELQRPEG